MQLPFDFPDWMPWWLQLIVVVAVILLAMAFAIMPFSVFGVKARLDGIEARLDEIQGEIRTLALRLPEARLTPATPPIPPPRETLSPTLRAAARLGETRTRAEPRLGRTK